MPSRPLHAVLLPALPMDAIAAAIDGTGPALLPLDPGLPGARLRELVDALAPSAIWTEQGRERLPGPATGVAPDVAVVLATSGSTGAPKGAEITAEALLASARSALSRLAGPGPRATHSERWLCCLPTHHISGLGVLVRSLVTGTDPVLASRVDAAAIESAGCGYVSLVPTQLSRLLEAGAPLAGFRAILLGGSAIPPGLLRAAAAAGARVVTSYGMTETCGGCVYDGVPLDGVQAASSADGRIMISGPVLFSRYRLAPALTRASLRAGWFTTADLGGIGPGGRLVVRGRADDVINTGGEKVVPGEVEAVLRGCDGVRDVAVVGAPDPDWGELVTAVIVPGLPAMPVVPGGPGTAAGTASSRLPGLDLLREAVQAKLPRYAAPRRVVYVDEIPMLASGKPDRLQLRNIAAGTSVRP